MKIEEFDSHYKKKIFGRKPNQADIFKYHRNIIVKCFYLENVVYAVH